MTRWSCAEVQIKGVRRYQEGQIIKGITIFNQDTTNQERKRKHKIENTNAKKTPKNKKEKMQEKKRKTTYQLKQK